MNPIHVDGRTLVVIRRTTSSYAAEESGLLSYDGQTLELQSTQGNRVVTESEIANIQPIIPSNQIGA
ncbi:MAG TPA: hypothetical protein VGJ26_22225, partial [Pirellulales bacterium]